MFVHELKETAEGMSLTEWEFKAMVSISIIDDRSYGRHTHCLVQICSDYEI